MPYLDQERTRLQTDLQVLVTKQSSLTAMLSAQQEAVTAAQAHVGMAQAHVTQKRSEAAVLQKAAADADRLLAEKEDALRDGQEPLEGEKPAVWRARIKRLEAARDQARTEATTARAKFDAGQTALAQAQTAVQTAEQQVNDAKAVVAATQTAIANMQARQQTVQQQIDHIAKVNAEIPRDPINREMVEQLAAELSARVVELEDAFIQARLDQEDAEEHVRTIIARKAGLTQGITVIDGKDGELSKAMKELATAQGAFDIADENLRTALEVGR